MKRLSFEKNRKKYIDPNRLTEDSDDPKAYLKELAGLATVLGTGFVGITMLPNDRVYAAETSVDPKSQVVGSVSDSIQLNPSGKTNSKSTEKENSISNSEAQSSSTSKSLSISESVSDSISQSESISDIVSQSQSFSHSLSQSESVLSSLSLAKNKSTEKRSNTQKIHTSHLSSNEHSTVLQSNKNVEENSTGINRSANTSHVSKSTITSAYSSSSNNIPTASQASLDLNKNISSLVNLPLATNNTIERNNSTANSQLPITLGANFVTLATTNDTVVKPTFSGTVMIKNAAVVLMGQILKMGLYRPIRFVYQHMEIRTLRILNL